jgi:TetR/AcrR family transcriptional regulator, multidrug resistance operon repressor
MGAMEHLADKKRAILESTLELVKENGFHGTPMSMVAKEAGVAAGTIYHYFESKEHLICELYKYVMAQGISVLQISDNKTQTYKERFFSLWMGLYNFYTSNPNVLRFWEQFVNSPYNNRKAAGEHDELHKQLFSFFEEGIKEGHLRAVNPEVLGLLVHGSSISTAKVHGYGKIILSETDLRQIVQILWDGMSVQ